MCLYNAVVLSAIGLTLSLLLDDQVVMMYGITAGCTLIGTTATQAIIFIPKVCITIACADPEAGQGGVWTPPEKSY